MRFEWDPRVPCEGVHSCTVRRKVRWREKDVAETYIGGCHHALICFVKDTLVSISIYESCTLNEEKEIKSLSSLTHPHVIPNLYNFIFLGNTTYEILKKYVGCCFHAVSVNGDKSIHGWKRMEKHNIRDIQYTTVQKFEVRTLKKNLYICLFHKDALYW